MVLKILKITENLPKSSRYFLNPSEGLLVCEYFRKLFKDINKYDQSAKYST